MKISGRSVSAAAALMLTFGILLTIAAGTVSASDETVTKITKKKDVTGYTAAQISSEMGLGLSADDGFDSKQAAAAAGRGFGTIKVTGDWSGHISKDGKYTVDADWLAGIKKTVDAAASQDMYVVLSFDSKNKTSAEQKIVWSQIAESFAKYDRKVIFAGGLADVYADTYTDSKAESKAESGAESNTESKAESKAESNTESKADSVNSSANKQQGGTAVKSTINTIRAVKGCENRILLIDADDWYSVDTDANMIVSVSASGFAVNGNIFTDEDDAQLELQFGKLELGWLDYGVPVVIDGAEMSSFPKADENVKWAESFASGAKQLGVPVIFTKVGGKDDKAAVKLLSTYSDTDTTGTVIVTDEAEDKCKVAESGYVTMKAGAGGKTSGSIQLDDLLGDTDREDVKAIRFVSIDGFSFKNDKGFDSVKKLLYLDDIVGDEVVLTCAAGSTAKVRYEVLVEEHTLARDTKYLQFTEADGSGKCYARAVMMIDREEAEQASEVKFTFEIDGQVAAVSSSKFYNAVSQQGEIIKPEDGCVFVAAVIAGVPEEQVKTLTVKDIEIVKAEDGEQ